MTPVKYFDTSVLLPALNVNHPLRNTCAELLRDALQQGTAASTTLPIFAELYTHLTKPAKLKIHLPPLTVADLLIDQLSQTLTLIEFQRGHYNAVIKRCADLPMVSAIIYDALHPEAATSVNAEVLYTHNTRHFNRRLLPTDTLEIRGVR